MLPSSRRLLRRELQVAQQLVRLGPVNPGHPFIDVVEYRASLKNILRYDLTRHSQD